MQVSLSSSDTTLCQDTEQWPLLQAFALDDVHCPTGFFSARYAIVDITDNINVRVMRCDVMHLYSLMQLCALTSGWLAGCRCSSDPWTAST